MWLFLPWAATCVSKKFGLQVTLLLFLAHRNRSVIVNTVVLALNKKNHSISIKRDNGTQTKDDSEAASSSQAKPEEGPCQMETDVSSCSKGSYAKSHSAETAVSLLGYDYNMYAGVPPLNNTDPRQGPLVAFFSVVWFLLILLAGLWNKRGQEGKDFIRQKQTMPREAALDGAP